MDKEHQKSIYLEVKDHTVSGELFQLVTNDKLEMLETFPQPSEDKLPEYYQSEDYISHTDSTRSLFEKAYHFIKSIALKRKLKLLNSFSKNKKNLLDIGCGTGDFLQIASKHGWSISGIEPNDQARALANKKTDNAVYDVDQLLKFNLEKFDVITLWHVLEHLPNLNEQILKMEKLLKPNGTILIAVPNYKSFDADHYKEFWAAYDVPRHLWHFSKASISSLVGDFGLTVIKTLPMKFDAYYVSLLSEKYKSGYMNPIKAIWTGWLSNLKARSSGEYSSLIYVIKKT